MATSSEVYVSPDAGYFEWEHPEGVVRFTEFSLTQAPPFRQIDLKYENPLCRLASRTSAGAQVCGQGCGMCGATAPASHTCPFGMLMVQAPAAPGAAATRWVGRRFPDVDAMHEGLDRLADEGLGDETILAHLPPNPIASAEEMRLAAGVRREAAVKAATVVEEVPVSASDAKPERAAGAVDSLMCNLLEYLEQVHRLIAGATRAEAVCERFLRAVAAVVPFDEMAIYLRGRNEADWVIATTIESGRIQGTPRMQACHLEPDGLGAAAIAQRRILVYQHGKTEPFAGRLEGPATLAIPFPLAGGGALCGVWLALQGDSPRACALGDEVVRYMRLLSEFLGGRLQQIEELAEAHAPEPVKLEPARAEEAEPKALQLADALCGEMARVSRHDPQPFTLLCLNAQSRPEAPLPYAALTREFGAILRPYDTMVADPKSPATWFVVLPYAHEAAARMVAARLMTVFEDVLDGCGGMEEMGARLAVGGSVWGADAAAPEQMIVNATGAAGMAQEEGVSAIRFFAEAPVVQCQMANA